MLERKIFNKLKALTKIQSITCVAFKIFNSKVLSKLPYMVSSFPYMEMEALSSAFFKTTHTNSVNFHNVFIPSKYLHFY